MPPIKAVFFDIGDTLVFDDPPLRERFRIAARQAGIDYPQERFADAYRLGEEHAITRYLRGEPFDAPDVLFTTASCILTTLGVPELTEERWRVLAEAFAAVPRHRTLHPQALPLVQELRTRGFRLGAISDWDATLPGLLAEMGLASHLEALAVSALVGCTKPDPRMFHEALRQMGVGPAAALHVGDWYELDVQGARRVGMAAVLFDHQRRQPQCDCPRAESFDDLAAMLLSLPCPV